MLLHLPDNSLYPSSDLIAVEELKPKRVFQNFQVGLSARTGRGKVAPMPILNFERMFVEQILDGHKSHTMRFGVRTVHKGQLLYCQYGSRFRPTRFAVLPAMRVREVRLSRYDVRIFNETGLGFIVPARDAFARADGFRDWDDLRTWFDSVYGWRRESMTGQLIQWAEAGWEK